MSLPLKALPTAGKPITEISPIQEKGVETAIQAIYRDLEYARTLIKHRDIHPDNDIGDEESWTFIGDDSDPELVRRIAEWEPKGRASRDASRPSAYEKRALGTRLLSGTVREASPHI